MKAIEIGIHSVGTNPIGLDHALSVRPSRVSILVSITATASLAMLATYKPAAVGVDGQRHRLGAKVALPRQPRIEVALDRELPAPTLTAATASRLASAT